MSAKRGNACCQARCGGSWRGRLPLDFLGDAPGFDPASHLLGVHTGEYTAAGAHPRRALAPLAATAGNLRLESWGANRTPRISAAVEAGRLVAREVAGCRAR